MGLMKKQINRFQVAVALYKQMGFFSLNPTLRRMWLEKEQLDNEIKDLRDHADKAGEKLDTSTATLFEERVKFLGR